MMTLGIDNKEVDRKYIIILAAFAFIFLFFASKMSPLYPINEWSDVNVYFNIGKAMMNGRTMYTEAFDHKGPLIFVIYALGYLLSNDSFFGIFVIQLLVWWIMIYAIFQTARLFLTADYAVLTALLTPIFIKQHMYTGGSAEEFILAFSFVSLFYFCKYYQSKQESTHSPRIMFIHGLLSCMAIFIKINLSVFWIFPLLGIFLCLLCHKEYKNILHNVIAYLAGAMVIALPIILYLHFNDALDEAYNIYIGFNMRYGSLHSFHYTLVLVKERMYDYIFYNKIGCTLSIVGAFVFPLLHLKNRIGKAMFLAMALSLFFMIFTPRTFHFYYPLSLYVFIPLGFITLWAWFNKLVKARLSTVICCCVAVFVLSLTIYSTNFFGYSSDELLRKKKPNDVVFKFSEIITKQSNPTLLNLGFGVGNAIFTLSNIVPTQQYFITPNIYYNMYPDIRDSQTRYIENKEVDFIVIDNFAFNYEYFNNLESLHTNYQLVDTFVNEGLMIKNIHSTYYLYKKK